MLRFFDRLKKVDWWAVVGSLLFAAFIWLFDALNRGDYVAQVDLPIQISHTEAGVVAFQPPQDQLGLVVEGNGWDLMKLKLGIDVRDFELVLDQPIKKESISFNEIRVQVSEHLSHVRVLDTREDSLYFKFDTLITEKIPLWVNEDEILFEENYRLVTKISRSVDSILVTYPSVLKNQIPDTLFLRVPEKNIDDNYDEWLTLRNHIEPKLKNGLVSFSPNKINITFGTDLFLRQQQLIQVQSKNFPERSKAILNDSTAMLSYYVQRTNELIPFPDSIFAIADFKDLRAADSILPLELPVLPEIYLEPTLSPSVCIIDFKP
ncbi:MAG: hypothetical protein AAF740_08515 [Bacteroidota bacterium]